MTTRRLEERDLLAAQAVSFASLRSVALREGDSYPSENTLETIDFGIRRLRHFLEHDPDGAWVAEHDGAVCGVALASVRGDLWFLSLLAVAEEAQGMGLGRALLENALSTFPAAGRGWVLASKDHRALRAYHRAGFTLLPAYRAHGVPQAGARPLTAVRVRQGHYEQDRDLVEEVAGLVRGSGPGPDLDVPRAAGHQLLVAERGLARGYALATPSGAFALAATDVQVAQALLWQCLEGVADHTASLQWLTGHHAWAIDVALAARLALSAGPTVCVRDCEWPPLPYLPSGAYG